MARKSAKRKKAEKKLRNIIIIILIIAVVAFLVYSYINGTLDQVINTIKQMINGNGNDNGGGGSGGNGGGSDLEFNSATYDPAVIKEQALSIHFLELGNKYTGDSVYIKAGDTDILIDAGSRKNSAETIKAYVDNFCTDGKLEYVIATHAHQDHIAGFIGTKSGGVRNGIFTVYQVGTIIEFTNTNDKDKALYKEYLEVRNAQVDAGAKLVTALDCVKGTNGGQKVYDLTGDGSITMEVLYQKFYDNVASDENDYSVCVMIRQGDNQYLFTGDLEKEGEESLVQENDLGKVVLFKGGHHGSKTSSNDFLLKEIKPDIVCVCCCTGSDEYTDANENQFPTQQFVNNVAPYTDNVYATSIVSDNAEGYTSMNGNIVLTCDNGKDISMYFSNNSTKLKDTEWFKNNRICPDAWKEQ